VVYRVADTLTAKPGGLGSLQCSPHCRASGRLVTELDVATGVARRGKKVHNGSELFPSTATVLRRSGRSPRRGGRGAAGVEHNRQRVIRDAKPIPREAEKALREYSLAGRRQRTAGRLLPAWDTLQTCQTGSDSTVYLVHDSGTTLRWRLRATAAKGTEHAGVSAGRC
jgi:hypothetical protein